ncbi:MAG: pentapeptide repeat-containing protein [Gammaproteobacteria bacterium]|nr:pentapeptide repeat-containing protein [Gammaproteobacteria bacterium]
MKELLKKWGQLLWQRRWKYALPLRWLWARSLPLLRRCWERGKRQVPEFCLRRLQPWLPGIFICLCLLFLILLLYAVLLLPHAECEGDNLRLLCYWLGVGTKEAVINRLSIALTGLLSAWAIWSAYRRAEAMQKQALAAENSLVQERFRDAVQHLGDKSASARLGGAYALFRLALEEEAFRKQIAEMICTHILSVTGAKEYRGDFAKKPSMEIQSLMRLLFSAGQDDRTENSRKAFWKGLRADLSGGYFHGLELRDARFQKASLTGAEFQGASLSGAQFQGASLVGTKFHVASLENSQFHDAYLLGAEFHVARLLGAEFHDAHLYRAEFHGASLVGAEFHGAYLLGAEFHGAYLNGAEFHVASLENAQFQGATLENAEFQGARLYRVRFQGAELGHVGFQGAFFARVKFHGASLVFAGFQGAFLDDAQFQGATLENAEFHGASLKNAQFQGVTSSAEYGHTFEQRIRGSIGRDADLSAIVFAGGLRQAQIDQWVDGIKKSDEDAEDKIEVFKQRVGIHVGKEISSFELPDGAQGGRYGEEEAKRWIEEYNKAMEKAEAKVKAAGGDNEVKQP